ncbi:MAG: TetR/AcrR family transcriptional regulator [Pseudomonadales bacterium]|nr:TetR/AcrR family transcriptional regulator [Pseudomonadales bacterium]
MSSPRRSYHHGDLRASLVEAALTIIKLQGMDALSLRHLAEYVGVSATAIYHHFHDKQDLLGALSLLGLQRFEHEVYAKLEHDESDWQTRYRNFVHAYLNFALEEPELYELMFGRSLWKQPGDDNYRQAARQAFRRYSEALIQTLPEADQPLRLAQMGWATLHGLVRMLNDGLAFRAEDINHIADYAVDWLVRRF